MVVRKRKKINRLLGQRTRGNGDTKNRRGAGSRGGRGLAGSHKHKWSKYYGKFGKEKRKVLEKTTVKALNIDQLLQIMPKLLESKKLVKESGNIVVDGRIAGFDKLLGSGELKEKLLVRNLMVSKKAAEKIKKAGGKVEEMAEGLKADEEFEAEEEPAEEKKEPVKEKAAKEEPAEKKEKK